MRREHDLDRLYDSLARLRGITGERLLRDPRALDDCPEQGVYFFFEPGELRQGGTVPRVVRVGTHAVSRGAAATLAQRLRQHRGTLSGTGNHRGSIFRSHVGSALLRRDIDRYPASVIRSWSSQEALPENRAAEAGLELEVSRYIGRMPLLWVAVPGLPQAHNDRRYIESNAIAVLSDIGKAAIDPPSPTWLGRSADSQLVRASGLWNVRDVDGAYDEGFLEFLDACVAKMTRSNPPAAQRAEVALPMDPELRHGPRSREVRTGGTLVLVACGQKKIWSKQPQIGAVPAKDAYIGPVFSAERRVAEAWGLPWMILSAKYGFLDPTEQIRDYNVTFLKPRTNPISAAALRTQVRGLGLDELQEVRVLGGSRYAQAARVAFAGTKVRVTSPVAGLRLGEMLQRLNELVRQIVEPGTSAVTTLAPQAVPAWSTPKSTAPRVADFEAALRALLAEAKATGEASVDVLSADLHRRLVPPGINRMPSCCGAMRNVMRSGDEILRQPLKGNGTTLLIRYRLPS